MSGDVQTDWARLIVPMSVLLFTAVLMTKSLWGGSIPLRVRRQIKSMSEADVAVLFSKLQDVERRDPSPGVSDSDRLRWFVSDHLDKLRCADKKKMAESLACVREVVDGRERKP